MEAVTLWETHAGQGSWQDLWPYGGSTLEQSAPEGMQPMEVTQLEAVHVEIQSVGKTDIEVHGGPSPVGENSHAGAEKEDGESSPEDKGAAKKVCDELTTTPISVSLCH